MGKGMAFLNLKFFHPGNRDNQRRKWEAIQKDNTQRKKLLEREQQKKTRKRSWSIKIIISNKCT